MLLLFSFSNVLFIFLDVHHPETITVSLLFLFISRFNVWKGNQRQNVKVELVCSLNSSPNTHFLVVSSTLFFQFFKIFASFSLSPSSFTRSISLPFSTIFQFYFHLRLTLWFLNYASRRFMWFFSPESFSIFFVCFHPIGRPYQPPTFSSFLQYFFIMIWVFRLHLFNFSLHLSIIFHNIQIFLFHLPLNTFLFFLRIFLQIFLFHFCQFLFKCK